MLASFFVRALTRPHSLLTAPSRRPARRGGPADPHDQTKAFAEGWGVFDCGYRDDGSRRIELQRLDDAPSEPPRFDDDTAAWRHVVAAAASGSRRHAAALASLDPIERLAIEAACGWCPGQ